MAINPRWSRSEDAIRGVLLCGSLVFALSALALLGAPVTFAQLLGLESSPATEWTLRMVGACLLALCGQMFLVRSAPNRQVRGAAAVMIVGGGAMTVLTLFVPGDWTPARLGYLAIGATFLLLYVMLLWLGAGRPAVAAVTAGAAAEAAGITTSTPIVDVATEPMVDLGDTTELPTDPESR